MLNETTASTFDFATFANLHPAESESESSGNDDTLNETSEESMMNGDVQEFMAQFEDDMTIEEASLDDTEAEEWVANTQDEFDLFGDVTAVSQQRSDESQSPVVNDTITTTFVNLDSSAEDNNVREPEVEKVISSQDEVTYVKQESSDEIIAELSKNNPTNTLNVLDNSIPVFAAQHTNGIHKFNYYQSMYSIPPTKVELYQEPYKSLGELFTLLYVYTDANNQTVITKTPTLTSKVIGMFSSTTTVSALPNKPNLHDDVVISPFVIVGFVQNENGSNFGPILRFISKAGDEKLLHLLSSDIEENKHIKILLNEGFHITNDPKVRETFKKFLTGHYKKFVKYKVPYVDKLGYSDVYHGFYTPDGVLHQADGEKFTWFDCGEEHLAKVTPKGSFQAWQDKVAKVAVQYPFTAFSLMTAFGAPFLQLLKLNTIFFHYYGRSSKGKTTLLQIPISVFANGADPNFDPEGSFIDKWNTTTAGLELKARFYNGGIAAFDELHK